MLFHPVPEKNIVSLFIQDIEDSAHDDIEPSLMPSTGPYNDTRGDLDIMPNASTLMVCSQRFINDDMLHKEKDWRGTAICCIS